MGPSPPELPFAAEVRLCRRPIIKTEHPLNDTVQRHGYVHRSTAPSIKSAGIAIDKQSNAEGSAKVCNCASQVNRSCGEVPTDDPQAMPACKPNYFQNVRWIRA